MKKEKKKWKIAVPNTYVVIVVMIILFAALTWIVPAGTYDMVEADGRKVVDAQSLPLCRADACKPMENRHQYTHRAHQAGVFDFLFVFGFRLYTDCFQFRDCRCGTRRSIKEIRRVLCFS